MIHKLTGVSIVALAAIACLSRAAEPAPSLRLPGNVPPVIAVWGWRETDFEPGGYEPFVDMMAQRSGVNLLTTTIRAPLKEVTDPTVHDQIKRATDYTSRFGIGIAMDLDVRLAREAFRKAYPDELQEMLRLREIKLKGSGDVMLSVPSDDLGDHYTYMTTHYIPLSGRLMRAFSYKRGTGGIKPGTIREITPQCRATKASAEAVSVSIHCDERMEGTTACVVVSFAHFAPDVFAPHLLSFQRQILGSYRDVPLAGACKDEWGFPPCFDGNPAHNDYWYSASFAKAYAEQTGGREFLSDCLLMTYGEAGREAERLRAINDLNDLSRQRNGRIETDFYEAAKATWGPNAVVATHPTWWPYPDRREFKKNGLDWWIAKRDWAQTDEISPYCVRTALAKKWNSPVWFNMYYSPGVPDYQAELWAGALTGGRINYHGLWPVDLKTFPNEERYRALLRGGLMRGDCRVRLLNFITRSPLDCPVAVVFGQPGAMNWARGTYDDVGLTLANALWQAGYPADLIPTTEIWNGSVTLSADGYLQYGPQRYRAALLYHPDLDKDVTAELFRKAAAGKTALLRVGEWTCDFDGKPFDGATSLPRAMAAVAEPKSAVERITSQMTVAGIQPQPRADRTIGFGECRTVAPPASGESHLLDGTHIIVAGRDSAAGDLIQRSVNVHGHPVTVDAVGLFAIRLDQQGHVEAFAAGGLKSLNTDGLSLELSQRIDVVMFRDDHGQCRGVLQDYAGPIPAPLLKLTETWSRLSTPVPLQ